MLIVLLYRVRFQASCNGSHFELELEITTYSSMRNMISKPTNQTKAVFLGVAEGIVG